MQGMGNFRLGRRTVMYTVETIPKGKNRVLGVSDRSLGEPPLGRELGWARLGVVDGRVGGGFLLHGTGPLDLG